MHVVDATLKLHPGMVIYPGDSGFRKEARGTIAGGKGSNTSELAMGSHTGTHVDAPLHMIALAPAPAPCRVFGPA